MSDVDLRFELSPGNAVVARAGVVTAVCEENGSGLPRLVVAAADRLLASASGGSPRGGRPRSFPLTLVDRRRALTGSLDVAENVSLGIEFERRLGPLPLGIDVKRTRAAAAEALDRVGCALPPSQPARELGEFDRLHVELARAALRGSSAIVLDEPGAELGEEDTERLFAVLRGFAERGVAILVLTRRPREAMERADEIVAIRDGEIVGRHVRSEWSASPAARASVRAALLRELVDRTPRRAYPEAPPVPVEAGELLRISGWTARDPLDRSALLVDDAGLAVRAGEIVGLAGLPDSGAEDLLLSVYGRSAGTGASGQVEMDGRVVDTATVEKAISAGLYFASTDTPRYRMKVVGGISIPVPASRVASLAATGLLERGAPEPETEGWGRKALGAARSMTRAGDDEQHILGLVREFAGSERTVLMLGQPTRGMTESEREELYAGLVRSVEAGKGVVLISSELDELLGLCHRVVVMADGRVTGEVARGADPGLVAALMLRD